MTPIEVVRVCIRCERAGAKVMFKLPWVPHPQSTCVLLGRTHGPRTRNWHYADDSSVVAFFDPKRVRLWVQHIESSNCRESDPDATV